MNEITRSSIASDFLETPMRGGLLGQGIRSGYGIIGIKSRVWSLRYQGQNYYFERAEDRTPLPYIDVVMLEENPNVSKTYYPGQYTEDSNNAPTCSAINGDVPDPGVPIPQSPTCATCKHNIWITLPTGRKGQECRNSKRLAVLLMPSMTEKMLGAPLLEPVLLRVPGASHPSLKKYGDSLRHRGIHSAWVVTRISFDRTEQFQMNFDTLQPLTNAEVPEIKKLMDNPLTSTIAGTQPAVYEAGTQLPPKREERVETGILGAFGREQSTAQNSQGQVTTMKPRAGRPSGSPNKPKPVQIIEEQVAAELDAHVRGVPHTQEATSPADEQQDEGVPWSEADPELSDTLKKVISSKIQGALK